MGRSHVFVSYSHKDQKWLEEFTTSLQPHIRSLGSDAFLYWDDNQIKAGSRWHEEIQGALASARIAVLLVSANYLASRFIATAELPAIFRREAKDGLLIIWIPVSASAYNVTDLKDYQAASDPMRPLDTLSPAQRRQAWVSIAQSVADRLNGVGTHNDPEESFDDTPEEGNVVLLYKRDAVPDDQLLKHLERALTAEKFPVFIDRHVTLGWPWADAISRRIEKAIAVIPLLSAESMRSDMLADEMRLARKTAQLNSGRPHILPVRVRLEGPLPAPFDVFNSIQHGIWKGPEDSEHIVEEMKAAIKKPFAPLTRYVPPAGGALAANDPFYIERREDAELKAAIERHEAFVLLRGARQMGKTSMAARGLNGSRTPGTKSVFMDFQKMNETELKDIETFYKSIIQWLCDELDLDLKAEEFWSARRPPNSNLERFVLQRALPASGSHLIWVMDEVDRLLVANTFSSEFFGLLRTWHNNRSVKPQDGWDRLTVVIAYATEPHLFITSLDQSPFNIGLKLNLRDFVIGEVVRLHDKYSAGLTRAQIETLFELLAGQPYLTNRGFAEILRGRDFDDLVSKSEREDGPFGDHLRRILVVLARNPELKQAVAQSLYKQRKMALEELYRLRRAGIFVGETPEEARPRCKLYDNYLRRHLPA